VLKYLKSILLFSLLLTFQAKVDNGYYPGTVLLHLDSIDNKLFLEQCSELRPEFSKHTYMVDLALCYAKNLL
jgi:hypothetical protein